ncbi:MAG: P-type conjugative transfer protein TrbL [Burkholderiales bacterium]
MKKLRLNPWPLGGLFLLLLLLVPMAHAAPPMPSPEGFLDNIQKQFQTSTTSWMTISQGYARHIFVQLAALELFWTGAQLVLKKNDLADIITGAFLKLLAVLFFFMMITEAPTWIPLIISSFTKLGGAFSAGAVFTPSGVMQQGYDVTGALWNWMNAYTATLGFVDSIKFIPTDLIVAASSLLVLIGFGLLALQFLVTLIESYIVLGMGMLMLGFLGSHWTSSWGEKYFGYAVSVGVKIMVIAALCGLGVTMDHQFVTALNSYATAKTLIPPSGILSLGVSSLIFGGLGILAPSLASSMMNGTPSMGLGSVAGATAGITAAAVAGGAAIAAGVGAAGEGLSKMAGLVGGGGAGTAGGLGGIGGSSTDKLAALGGMTGGGGAGGAPGAIGGAGKPSAPSANIPGGIGGAGGGIGPTSASGGMAAVKAGQASRMMMDSKLHAGTLPSGPASATGPGGAKPAGATPSGARFAEGTAADKSGVASGGAPASGTVDSLGAQATADTGGGLGKEGNAKTFGEKAWDLTKNSVTHAHDQTQRHGDGGGGGLSIRLGHPEV